jgi:CysZ protein
MQDFILGFRYPLAGLKLIRQPGIRLFVVIPLLINALLFSLIIAYGAHQIINLGEWLSARWGWADWIVWIIWPLFAVLAVSVVFYGFSLVANLLAAPFNEFLAAAVLAHLSGRRPVQDRGWSSLPRTILTGLRGELGKFVYFAALAVSSLILFVIPLVNAAAPFIWIAVCSWLIALEYMAFPMGNDGLTFAEIRAKLRTRRMLVGGFGMGVLLWTMVPFVNFLAMPVAVASAAQLWTREFSPIAASGNARGPR